MSEQFETIRMLVRVPADAKRWLEREAKRNVSSQTSEVVRSIRLRMEAEQGRGAD